MCGGLNWLQKDDFTTSSNGSNRNETKLTRHNDLRSPVARHSIPENLRGKVESALGEWPSGYVTTHLFIYTSFDRSYECPANAFECDSHCINQELTCWIAEEAD